MRRAFAIGRSLAPLVVTVMFQLNACAGDVPAGATADGGGTGSGDGVPGKVDIAPEPDVVIPTDGDAADSVADVVVVTDVLTDAAVTDAKVDGGADVHDPGDVPVAVDAASDSSALPDTPDAGPPPDPFTTCSPTAFPVETIPLPEASGAAFVKLGGKRLVYVTSDSGNEGAAIRIDVDSGAVVPFKLPLKGATGDDTEGLSIGAGPILYGITSSGWMREWTIKSDGTVSVLREAYPLAEPGSKYLCDDGTQSNCAANFEGLCLHPSPAAGADCVGYAASKAKGSLVCLVKAADGRLQLEPKIQIMVAANESLSGCHYAPVEPYTLLAVTNAFGGSRVFRIDGPSKPPADMGVVGTGFPEAVAVDDDLRVIVFSDLANLTPDSMLVAFSCK